MTGVYYPHPGAQSDFMAITIVSDNDELSRRVLNIVEAAERVGISVNLLRTGELGHLADFQFIHFDEYTRLPPVLQPIEASPKRKALIAQLERAKLRRDKNSIRDLTRQLEHTL